MHYESRGPFNHKILQKAVDILNEFGMTIFENHCDKNEVSYCDRNRCIAKCKILYKRDDLMEIPIPDNLKMYRWNFYTQYCQYSTRRAGKLLKAVDASHENQFTPNFDKHDFEIGA